MYIIIKCVVVYPLIPYKLAFFFFRRMARWRDVTLNERIADRKSAKENLDT